MRQNFIHGIVNAGFVWIRVDSGRFGVDSEWIPEWVPGGFRVGSGWVPGGFRVGSGWVPGGFRVDSGWVPGGFRVGSGWVPGGLGWTRVDKGGLGCIRGVFGVDSGWIRGGFGVDSGRSMFLYLCNISVANTNFLITLLSLFHFIQTAITSEITIGWGC